MTCPKCGEDDSTCYDTRKTLNPPYTRRRRQRCNCCTHRWTTFELEATPESLVWLTRKVNDAPTGAG